MKMRRHADITLKPSGLAQTSQCTFGQGVSLPRRKSGQGGWFPRRKSRLGEFIRFNIDGHASKVLQAANLAQQLEDIANMEPMFGQGERFPWR